MTAESAGGPAACRPAAGRLRAGGRTPFASSDRQGSPARPFAPLPSCCPACRSAVSTYSKQRRKEEGAEARASAPCHAALPPGQSACGPGAKPPPGRLCHLTLAGYLPSFLPPFLSSGQARPGQAVVPGCHLTLSKAPSTAEPSESLSAYVPCERGAIIGSDLAASPAAPHNWVSAMLAAATVMHRIASVCWSIGGKWPASDPASAASHRWTAPRPGPDPGCSRPTHQ